MKIAIFWSCHIFWQIRRNMLPPSSRQKSHYCLLSRDTVLHRRYKTIIRNVGYDLPDYTTSLPRRRLSSCLPLYDLRINMHDFAWALLKCNLCGLVVRVPIYRYRDPGFGSQRYQIFWEIVGLELGPLSLVSTTEELLGRNSSGSGLETQEYGRGDPLSWPRDTVYPQKLALTSPTCGGRSVGIVRLLTKTTEFFFEGCYIYELMHTHTHTHTHCVWGGDNGRKRGEKRQKESFNWAQTDTTTIVISVLYFQLDRI
jgi:hypothetical protein